MNCVVDIVTEAESSALSAQYANSARAWWLGRCWRLGPVASHQ